MALWNLNSFPSHLRWCRPLHLAFLDNVPYATPTFNKWHKKKNNNNNKKGTLHILTFLVVCINEKNYDIRERNVTIRSDIWTTNIRSLGFRDIREWMISWRLVLRSLRCIGDTRINMSNWIFIHFLKGTRITYTWKKEMIQHFDHSLYMVMATTCY